MVNETNKPVHVKAYVKDDGTEVRAHQRSLPDGISHDGVYEEGEYTQQIGSVGNIILGSGTIKNVEKKMYNYQMTRVLKCRNELENASKKAARLTEQSLQKVNTARYSEDMYDSYEFIRKAQIELNKAREKILKELGDCNNQQEYSKLYNDFVKNEEFIQKAGYFFLLTKYAYDDGNYAEMRKNLQEYYNINQKRENYYKNLLDLKRYIGADHPQIQKPFIHIGMTMKNFKHQADDAYELMKISLYNYHLSSKYIEKNGVKLNSIASLPIQKVDKVVYNKVKSQLNINDASGILLHSESSLAKSISQNEYFRKKVSEHKDALLQGKKVDFSVAFSQSGSKNLRLALGNADIVDMHISANGYLRAFVVDTYDFNDDDPDWKVEVAHNVQDHGLLTNYFVVVSISIPLKDIKPYLQ